MAELNEKQKRFCEEYIIDLNGAQAAIRAGYSPKSARKTANKLRTNADIQKYIDKLMAEKKSELIADQDEVLETLTSILRRKSLSSVVVIEGKGEGISKARVIQKPPDEKEVLKAAELLGKRYGAFTDKTEITGELPVVIHDDVNPES